MNLFLIKFKDGTEQTAKASITNLSGFVKQVSLCELLDYEKIEYIELALHEENILAGDEGYYLIGAGNGECKNRDYGISSFKPMINREEVLKDCFMPVFGISHNGACRIAIVTGMQYDVAQVITIKDNSYSIKIRFIIDGLPVYENIAVEFHTLSSDATYCDMAKEYRKYQLNHGFRPLRERLTPELEYSLDALNVRIRMAWKPVPCQIHEQTIENEPDVQVACTFDDVLNLMENYKASGIEKAEFCLVGWNIKGHDGRWPQILPVEESIGGEEGLKKVIKRAKELGYAVTCHTNSTDCYSIANNFNIDNIAKLRDGQYSIEAVYWAGGKTYNACPKFAYETSMETLPEVAELRFRGMHYIDVITATSARQCFESKHPINKRQSGECSDCLFKKSVEMFGSVGSEGAYDHSLKNCDYTLYVSFLDFTDNTENNSMRFDLCEKLIPFWQIAYHGIVASNPYARTVNFAASENKDDMLKVIEFGGKPQIYYYAKFVNDGKDWIGKGDFNCHTCEGIENSTKYIKETADMYKDLSYLQYEFIENHIEKEPNVFETTYSDGSVTVVDYNKKSYSLRKGVENDNY